MVSNESVLHRDMNARKRGGRPNRGGGRFNKPRGSGGGGGGGGSRKGGTGCWDDGDDFSLDFGPSRTSRYRFKSPLRCLPIPLSHFVPVFCFFLVLSPDLAKDKVAAVQVVGMEVEEGEEAEIGKGMEEVIGKA